MSRTPSSRLACPSGSTSSPRCTPATPPLTTRFASPSTSRRSSSFSSPAVRPKSPACCAARKNESLHQTPLSELWRHPIHTREFGSQLTNALRCLQLEAQGYQLTVTELVGWEHSLKNELIIARHTGVARSNATTRLEQILQQLNLDELRARFIY
jgi:hypothetical protein